MPTSMISFQRKSQTNIKESFLTALHLNDPECSLSFLDPDACNIAFGEWHLTSMPLEIQQRNFPQLLRT